MVAIVCSILTMFWQIFPHVAEVAQAKFVVYTKTIMIWVCAGNCHL